MTNSEKEAFEKVENCSASRNSTFIIGVAGGSASGKVFKGKMCVSFFYVLIAFLFHLMAEICLCQNQSSIAIAVSRRKRNFYFKRRKLL